jgi:hypothetical protein
VPGDPDVLELLDFEHAEPIKATKATIAPSRTLRRRMLIGDPLSTPCEH